MKKTILLLLLLSIIDPTTAQNDSLFNRQMNGILSSIKKIDSSANLVKKQKIFWCRKSINIKYYSATDKTIKHKMKLRNIGGKTYAIHKLNFGYSTKIKMTTQDDVPIFIRRKDNENNVITTFTYLGNSKWYLNHTADNQTKKYFVTKDISNWR